MQYECLQKLVLNNFFFSCGEKRVFWLPVVLTFTLFVACPTRILPFVGRYLIKVPTEFELIPNLQVFMLQAMSRSPRTVLLRKLVSLNTVPTQGLVKTHPSLWFELEVHGFSNRRDVHICGLP